jgi:CubicO group peptidase (beta-lactamase class C family)
MRIVRRRFLSLAAAAAAFPASSRFARSQQADQAMSGGSPVFPGARWEAVRPVELGWSVDGLAEANRLFDALPPASIVVVDRGRLILAWGDAARRVKLSSIRKSLLSALYGAPVREGRINLDDTLEHLGVDDDPPLTQGEKQATLRMLLQSRSGVYHSYVGGTPDMREKMPAREAHAPGAFWYYNNWDFNVLGAVYERLLDKKIGEAFGAEIAAPIQMEDFRPGDMYYARAAENAEAFARSRYPAYHFRLTARDMARFGYLFLRHGNWSGAQIIPAEWVAESTTSYGQTTGFGEGFGCGYLWWVDGYGLDTHAFSARGALGKYIIVIPERDLVVAFVNHTEFPDDPRAATAEEVKKLPDVRVAEMSRLLKTIVAAQGP